MGKPAFGKRGFSHKSSLNFLKRGGCGGGKNFFKKVFLPPQNKLPRPTKLSSKLSTIKAVDG